MIKFEFCIRVERLSFLVIYQSINQSLFVLTLAKKKITISMKILKVKFRVLAAWNNHRG